MQAAFQQHWFVTAVVVVLQVLARGEKIELLVDKCDDLRHQAQAFHKQGKQLRSRMW